MLKLIGTACWYKVLVFIFLKQNSDIIKIGQTGCVCVVYLMEFICIYVEWIEMCVVGWLTSDSRADGQNVRKFVYVLHVLKGAQGLGFGDR
jgi:hypothetical protein